ncbi:MAG: SDR family oxidoreductase [Proteobacteria bacterium]|nr:SDR family oxidoreductase [Pseudomonadota bacterium]
MAAGANGFDGRVAWITGSGRGMGRAHALLMAARGADIVVHDVLKDEAGETADAVRKLGRRVFVAHTDVRDVAGLRQLVHDASAALGPIDILVNNAGIGQHKPIEEITEEDFDLMFGVHVKGAFFCTQAVVPGMQTRRRGKIVNISSIWAMTGAGLNTASHYCAAKTAILGLTKAWAKELASWNICVNAVSPGGVLTEMPIKIQGWDKIREKEKRVPLGRWAQPEEISYAVAFLASAEADFITGQQISPNGGETIVGI